MTLRINPEKIKEKTEAYIAELEQLKSLNYEPGKQKMYSVDANVKSFLGVAFTDAKERNRDYQGIAIGVAGLDPQTEQKWYLNDLDSRIRTLNSWVEEMKLIMETQQGSSKLDEIRDQIEEKELEATRREKVAETKFYGAVIELLDFQRNMLKDKEANTKSLLTLQKDVQELKDAVQMLVRELHKDNG